MRVRKIWVIGIPLFILITTACTRPWVKVAPNEKIYTFSDIPINVFYSEPEQQLDKVFEEKFKFYRIYHNKETADPTKREQTVKGKTHFTARPVNQYIHVIQILITPEQEKWIRARGIDRQDVIRARVRFSGTAPGGSLAFDLLEIIE